MRLYPRSGFYLSLFLGGALLFGNALWGHSQLITGENLPLANEALSPESEAQVNPEGGAEANREKAPLLGETAVGAGAAAVTSGQSLPPPAIFSGEPAAPEPGASLPPGRHLAVREKRLADGHQVEQNLAGDPRYLGQEVISRPSGRKVYRYYSGQPHRPPESRPLAEQTLNPTVIIKPGSPRAWRPPAHP